MEERENGTLLFAEVGVDELTILAFQGHLTVCARSLNFYLFSERGLNQLELPREDYYS